MGATRLLPMVALAGFLIVGCQQQPTGQPNPTNPAIGPAGGEPVGSGVQSGKLTAYTDEGHRFRIGSPGPMKTQSDGSVAFTLDHERLVVAIVQGARAADPAVLADSDAASLGSSLSDFQIRSQRSEVTLGGRQMLRFTYGWTGEQGRGAALRVSSVRYYIPKDQSTLAVVTYGDDAKEFDVQEADGIAETFRWF